MRVVAAVALVLVLFAFAGDWIWAFSGAFDYNRCNMLAGPMVRVVGTRRLRVSWESCKIPVSEVRWSLEDGATRDAAAVATVRVTSTGPFSQVQHADIELDARSATGERLRLWIGNEALSVGVSRSFDSASEPLFAVVIGDNQEGSGTFERIVDRLAAHKPELVVHAGDMVADASSARKWHRQFYDVLHGGEMLLQCPYILAPGNHDVIPGGVELPPMLALPSGSRAMAATVGPVRWIVLDSNIEDDAQIAWLSRELDAAETKAASFRVVVVHVPPFTEYWDPATWHAGESSWSEYVRGRVVPLLAPGRVDLMLSGHQHNYQRGARDGVAYVVTGGAGGSLDSTRVQDTGVYSKTYIGHHYLVLRATADELRVEMHTLDGSPGDELAIKRRT